VCGTGAPPLCHCATQPRQPVARRRARLQGQIETISQDLSSLLFFPPRYGLRYDLSRAVLCLVSLQAILTQLNNLGDLSPSCFLSRSSCPIDCVMAGFPPRFLIPLVTVDFGLQDPGYALRSLPFIQLIWVMSDNPCIPKNENVNRGGLEELNPFLILGSAAVPPRVLYAFGGVSDQSLNFLTQRLLYGGGRLGPVHVRPIIWCNRLVGMTGNKYLRVY